MFGPKLVPDCGNCDLRLADAARSELCACGVVERDLAELGKVENRILENPVLLPLCEVRVGEVSGDGLQNVDVRLDVQADLFGDSSRDVFVAGDHRPSRRIAQRKNRDRAIDEQRQDSGSGEQQARTER